MKKSGGITERIFGGVIAVIITWFLYSSNVPPFSLLDAQKASATEGASAVGVTETPTVPIQEPNNGLDSLFIIIPESFDHTIEADTTKRAMKEGADTWPQTVTLVNSSNISTKVFLFVEGLKACPPTEPVNCVEFEPDVITVDAKTSAPIEIKFITIALKDSMPLEGKLILVGGGGQKEIPFLIKAGWQKKPFDSIEYLMVPTTGFITFFIALAVFYLLYLILYSKIIPAFFPEYLMSLRMDITDDNKTLWTIFSSRLFQMQEKGLGKNLTNPQPRVEKIDLPTNLGDKEGDILKAIVDLLSWIFPRRGRSIRLKSMVNKMNGKGLSVSLVRNSNDEVLAERVFWSSDYGIDPETMDFEDLLMTPIILWLSDSLKKGYPGKSSTNNMDWEVQSYCILANMLWSRDRNLGKKLYMDALYRDPNNKLAYAGLGRIWLEDAQQEGLTDDERNHHLELAISYLDEVMKSTTKTACKDATWFAAVYNRAVARLYLKDTNKAMEDCAALSIEITPRRRKDKDLELWLSKFRFLVYVFEQSVKLLSEPNLSQQKLKEMAGKAIKGLAGENEKNESTEQTQKNNAGKQGLQNTGGTNSRDTNNTPIFKDFSDPKNWLLVKLDYRTQYNAACYFSRCYGLAKEWTDARQYAEIALDYLHLALGHGIGLAKFAREDLALEAIRKDPKYEEVFNKIILKQENEKSDVKEESVLNVVINKPIVIRSNRRYFSKG